MSALAVEVIQEDIDNGECAGPHECALALGFARTLGRNPEDVWVGAFVARDNVTGKDYSLSGKVDPYGTPVFGSASFFIDAFDAGCRVKPATFILWEFTKDDIS